MSLLLKLPLAGLAYTAALYLVVEAGPLLGEARIMDALSALSLAFALALAGTALITMHRN